MTDKLSALEFHYHQPSSPHLSPSSGFVRQPTAKAMLAILSTRRNLALRNPRLKRTRPHVQLLGRTGSRRNIKIKDIHRHPDGRARIWNVHNARHMPLDRRTRKQEVDLVITVPEPPQVLNHPQRRLPVRHIDVEVVLLAVLVDAEAFKVNVPTGAELRLDGTRDVDGGFQAQVGHAVLHDLEVDGNDPRHLDSTTKGDFAVALREVQVTDRELGAGDVHGEIDLAAAGEVLDAVDGVSQLCCERNTSAEWAGGRLNIFGGRSKGEEKRTRSCHHAPVVRAPFSRPPCRPSPPARHHSHPHAH